MIEFRLQNSIFTFDGTIIEVFPSGQPSQRFHAHWVKTATIQVDKKGRQSLQIFMTGGGGFVTPELPVEVQAKAAEMVAAVQSAMLSQ